MTQLMQILDNVSDPIFFQRDGVIEAVNRACARLPLAKGDAAPPLPEGGHLEAELGGKTWQITVQELEGGKLVFLKEISQTEASVHLLAAAARGIREPLTSLQSACAVLFPALEELEDENIQAKTAAISRSCFRLLRCIGALMDFERLNGENPAIHREKTNILDFFNEQAALWQDMLQDGGIRLEYRGPEKSVVGNLDRNLTKRAVLNLLANAAAYHEEGTAVKLNVSASNGRLTVRVWNQGKAMDPDVFATAFHRYKRGSELGDDRWGAGLGLALTQAIARQHGGSVLLESGDSGTTVTMTMDLRKPTADTLGTPRTDPVGGYDPALVELSGVLPNSTYDTRNVDL